MFVRSVAVGILRGLGILCAKGLLQLGLRNYGRFSSNLKTNFDKCYPKRDLKLAMFFIRISLMHSKYMVYH